MPTLLLFYIDGTLITTGGAGYRAIKRAVEVTMGVERALEGIPVAGRTDSIILRDAVQAIDGRELTEELRDRVRDAYVGILEAEIELVRGGPGVLPGVHDLLARLAGDAAFHVALLTGNF